MEKQVLMIAPFVGLILSIGLLPLLCSKLWHKFETQIILGWVALACISLFSFQEIKYCQHYLLHTMWMEYVPFVALVFALYTISSGINLKFCSTPSVLQNCSILSLASLSSSFIGTMGSSMLFIRPFLKANSHRKQKVHLVVFFIVLVSNISGALTPLGDPPLYLGFLNGVPFLWTLENLYPQTLFLFICLMALFYFVDSHFLKVEIFPLQSTKEHYFKRWSLSGKRNICVITLVSLLVGLSKFYPKTVLSTLWGVEFRVKDIFMIGSLLLLGVLSHQITEKKIHEYHEFNWKPIQEVSIVFFAIFICLIPVNAVLGYGKDGLFSAIMSYLDESTHHAYFWVSGLFSAFLDNAPTYLLFMKLTGDTVDVLVTQKKAILSSISMGCVYMGAMTYIGNAPNFMVVNISKQFGIKMPTFFVYTFYTCIILIPLFVLVNWIW